MSTNCILICWRRLMLAYVISFALFLPLQMNSKSKSNNIREEEQIITHSLFKTRQQALRETIKNDNQRYKGTL